MQLCRWCFSRHPSKTHCISDPPSLGFFPCPLEFVFCNIIRSYENLIWILLKHSVLSEIQWIQMISQIPFLFLLPLFVLPLPLISVLHLQNHQENFWRRFNFQCWNRHVASLKYTDSFIWRCLVISCRLKTGLCLCVTSSLRIRENRVALQFNFEQLELFLSVVSGGLEWNSSILLQSDSKHILFLQTQRRPRCLWRLCACPTTTFPQWGASCQEKLHRYFWMSAEWSDKTSSPHIFFTVVRRSDWTQQTNQPPWRYHHYKLTWLL